MKMKFKLKNKIKGFFYNCNPDWIFFLIIGGFIYLAEAFVRKSKTAFICLLVLFICYIISLVCYLTSSFIKNRKIAGFRASKAIFFCRGCVWINQKMSCKGDICPVKLMIVSLDYITGSLKKGTVCYCRTHEAVIRQIMKKYIILEKEPCMKKSMKPIKNMLKNEHCNTCGSKKCSLLKDEKAVFYAVKFII